jgi:hypothetical protein
VWEEMLDFGVSADIRDAELVNVRAADWAQRVAVLDLTASRIRRP